MIIFVVDLVVIKNSILNAYTVSMCKEDIKASRGMVKRNVWSQC